MSEQQTQQPVAWIEACDLEDAATSGSAAVVIHGTPPDYEYVPLYPAPPVPRDVLIAALRDALVAAGEYGYDTSFVDASSIADRYADKVQPVAVLCMDSERVGFETVCVEQIGLDVETDDSGDYVEFDTSVAWSAWKARASQASAPKPKGGAT